MVQDAHVVLLHDLSPTEGAICRRTAIDHSRTASVFFTQDERGKFLKKCIFKKLIVKRQQVFKNRNFIEIGHVRPGEKNYANRYHHTGLRIGASWHFRNAVVMRAHKFCIVYMYMYKMADRLDEALDFSAKKLGLRGLKSQPYTAILDSSFKVMIYLSTCLALVKV